MSSKPTAEKDTPLVDHSDTNPLNIVRVAKHLGYPPPPEFQPLPDDFYNDLKPGYPVVEGMTPETDIDSEIYCFYLSYFVKHPILLYASAYSRESDRFSRKVSWDIFDQYGKVFYGFISSARMRKTLLQKLNRYRKKSAKAAANTTPSTITATATTPTPNDSKQGDNSEAGTPNPNANDPNSSSSTRLRRAAPERKKEKELMDQILQLHDRIIDTAIDSGASKRPHKNSSKEEINSPSSCIAAASGSSLVVENDNDNNHSEVSTTLASSGSSEKTKYSPRLSSAVMPVSALTGYKPNSSKTGTLSATTARLEEVKSGALSPVSHLNHPTTPDQTSTPSRKRSWQAIENSSVLKTPIIKTEEEHSTSKESEEKKNSFLGDREPTIQKLINQDKPTHLENPSTTNITPSKKTTTSASHHQHHTHHRSSSTTKANKLNVNVTNAPTQNVSSTSHVSSISEIFECMKELKKRDLEASVALDSINTDIQMLADQIDYIRHNLEMTMDLARKKQEFHNDVCSKIMGLLDMDANVNGGNTATTNHNVSSNSDHSSHSSSGSGSKSSSKTATATTNVTATSVGNSNSTANS